VSLNNLKIKLMMFKLAGLLAVFAGMGAAQPSIFSGGVINGASFAKDQAVAPGGLVAIFGTGLASATVPGDTIPLSAAISGTSVTFNGISAGLYFVSGGQVNAQMPWDVLPPGISSGTANMVVTGPGGASSAFAVQVISAAPGIFTSGGYAIAINADGSLAAPAGAISGMATHPAKVGDTLAILATGLGAVTPADGNGAASLDALRTTVATPVVLIGGAQAAVPFSGLSPQFPGINQVNVIVPKVGPGNSIPIQIQMNSITSTDQVVIAVQ
jgi:uncharacterized protein (TIGR03437 family)